MPERERNKFWAANEQNVEWDLFRINIACTNAMSRQPPRPIFTIMVFEYLQLIGIRQLLSAVVDERLKRLFDRFIFIVVENNPPTRLTHVCRINEKWQSQVGLAPRAPHALQPVDDESIKV